MKKFVATLLTLVMVFALTSYAFADSKPFHVSTSSTSVFMTGASSITRTNNKGWYASISASQSNLSPTHRAVARVHQQENAVSASWVYSGTDSTTHPYNAGTSISASGLSFRARLDNRDSGTLEFHGNFYYN